MARHKPILWIAIIMLAALFIGGLIQFARFAPQTGYPPYSSLQAGPGGAKLLFEALAKTGRVQVSRDYLPMGEAKLTGAAVFYLGVTPDALRAAPTDVLSKFEHIATSGNRLIIGIAGGKTPVKWSASPALQKRWGIRVSDDGTLAAKDPAAWHRPPGTESLERSFGMGSIVLLPHAERLNNESLARSASARALAAQLVGNKPIVVFEEAHLGIIESGSIAGLARHYRLQGLMAGLLLVITLFIWNRMWVFPPASALEESSGSAVVASDARLMFTSLLARHIGPQRLMNVCISEWNRLRPAGQGNEISLRPHAPDLQDPVAAYKNIQDQLQCKKISR